MYFIKNKILGLLIVLALSLSQVSASDIEIQPTMLSRSNEQDRVWVGTFQLVWNEFIDKYVHNPVRFREGTPAFVFELNKKTFNTSSLDEKSYYKYSGNVTKNTANNIKKAIKKKFNETSDILDSLNLTPSPNNYVIYSMLKKDFEFTQEFDKLGKSSFGQNMTADYFGIDKKSKKALANGVRVLYYNNKNDYAVILTTKDNDEVYLYKNSSNKEFKTLYADMNIKASGYKGERTFKNKDELKVPNIKFNVSKTFDELSEKRVMGTNIVINKAIETVKFNMNNKGIQLKSEAAMTFKCLAVAPDENSQPRYFYFDDTFVIFLKEKDKVSPYFALRVNDISKFQ